MLYLTWDASGMFLWLGLRPVRNKIGAGYSPFRNAGAVRLRVPVSWFGGLVDEGECREVDLEEVFDINNNARRCEPLDG